MNVGLGPTFDDFVAEMLKSGLYQSQSEILRGGLRLLKEREDLKRLRLAELLRETALGSEQADNGNLVDGPRAFASSAEKREKETGSEVTTFVFTPIAVRDLDEMWNYLAEDNLQAANRVLLALEKAMNKFARRPGIGHLREDLADKRLRFFLVHSYLIIYRPQTKPLQIVRVLHAARDLQSLRICLRRQRSR